MSAAAVKKQTHIQQRRELASKQEAEVMRLLNWTYLDYCNYKYEAGILFLDDYCRDSRTLYKILERSRTWWGWWKNHWTKRDAWYTDQGHLAELEAVSRFVRLNTYEDLHDVRGLIDELCVPEIIIDAAIGESSPKMNPNSLRAAFGNG